MLKKSIFLAGTAMLVFINGILFGEQYAEYKMLPAMQGLTVEKFSVKDLDVYTLPAGILIQRQAGEVVKLEGKIYRILYKASVTKSTYEIKKYYEKILKDNGFKTVFAGEGESLGNWGNVFYEDVYELHGNEDEQKFISAKYSDKSGDIYAAVYVTLGWYSYPIVRVDIIEVPARVQQAAAAEPKTQTIAVSKNESAENESSLEKQLKINGRVVVSGIDFKEGSADLKPESDAALREAAGIIKRNYNLKFVISCFTDSIGTPQYCRDLSQRRADAVFRVLTLMHGADKSRIKSKGWGFVSQADTNNMPKDEKAYGNRIELSIEE